MNEKKIVEKCKNSSFHLKNEIDILEKHALRSLSKISVWSLYPSLISLWVGNCLRSPMWLCVCTIQLKGRWSTHTLNLRTLFAFGAKKARGLSAFFLLFVHSFIHSFIQSLLFNALSMLCSALFRKTKGLCLKIPPPKHQINICISL